MTKLIKTSGEVQTHDFSKALGEAFERVEKRPKKKRKKKSNIKELARRVAVDDKFNVLVESSRTSMREPNIANPPRSGEMRGLASELVGSIFDGTVNYPMSTAIENLIDNEADKKALAERKVADSGTATGIFTWPWSK